MWVLIYPFIEKQSIYDYFANRIGTTYKGFELPCNTQWWINDVTEEDRKSISSVSIYRCPSRRGSGGELFTVHNISSDSKNNVNSSTNPASGPCGDYGMVFHYRDMTLSGSPAPSNNWYECTNVNIPAQMESKFGPFRLADHQLGITASVATDSKVVGSWIPRDTMAWWSDGTSNQLVVGEKHIPPYGLGKCDGDGTAATTASTGTSGRRSDCSYLTVNGWKSVGSARSFRHGGTQFPLSPMNYGTVASDGSSTEAFSGAFQFGFGSYHPGICPFLIGDGAVRSISITTPVSSILIPLSDVSDGEPVSLP